MHRRMTRSITPVGGQLYTDEEIETLIKPLADAGNASKCRFVYALHTFMKQPGQI